MNKAFYIFLIMQILVLNSSFAGMMPGHDECTKYDTELKQLNMRDAGYFVHEVYGTYKTVEKEGEEFGVEVPVCEFTKSSLGNVGLSTVISKDTPFMDVDKRLEFFRERLQSRFQGYEKYCFIDVGGYYVDDYSDPTGETYEINFLSTFRCSSEEDLSFIQNLDVKTLLESVGSETGFEVRIDGELSPVISGTTIHN